MAEQKSDRIDLETAITTAEGEAAIHNLVENGLLGLNCLSLEPFGLVAPEGHALVVMTFAQRQGLIESGARLRKAVEEISRAFYATEGAKDGALRG